MFLPPAARVQIKISGGRNGGKQVWFGLSKRKFQLINQSSLVWIIEVNYHVNEQDQGSVGNDEPHPRWDAGENVRNHNKIWNTNEWLLQVWFWAEQEEQSDLPWDHCWSPWDTRGVGVDCKNGNLLPKSFKSNVDVRSWRKEDLFNHLDQRLSEKVARLVKANVNIKREMPISKASRVYSGRFGLVWFGLR